MDRSKAENIYKQGEEAVVTIILDLDAECAALKEKLAALGKNSTNSDKPPSSDGPEVKRYPKKRPSALKQGAQPGHKGKKREMLPAHEVDSVVPYFPDHCAICLRTFSQTEKCPSEKPFERHQVWDIPPIKPVITEHQAHGCFCPDCGHLTAATLPTEITSSNFGARTHGAVAYLAVAHRATRRGISDIMKNFFNLDISTGAVCNVAVRVSEACAPVIDSIKHHTKNSSVLNIDETGWKNRGIRCYLWTFVSSLCVLFFISPARSSKVLRETLGDSFAGVIGSDDHSAYNAYHKNGIRQLCWAHLIRKFKSLKEDCSSPDRYLFARTMLKEMGTILTYWHAFPESGCSREQLWLATALIRGRLKLCCQRYSKSTDKLVRGRARRMLKNWDYLFSFLKIEGVEPTNNSAERALRLPVLWRSICFGSQSEKGERFTERLLSVIGTCRLQAINPFDFLASLMKANFAGQPVPLPQQLLPN